jgi:hypothetical protein
VFTGCSYTFGEGIPEEAVWGVQVAKTLGLSYANLGRPGASPYRAVGSVLSYLKRYKAKPKIILALMPDFKRFMTVPNPLISSAYLEEQGKAEFKGKGLFFANHWVHDVRDIPKYLKKPFDSGYTTSLETVFMQNIRAIQSLEMYCNVAGIKFLWSTWSIDETILFSNIKKKYPELLESYTDIKALHWPNHLRAEEGGHHYNVSGDDYYNVYHTTPNEYDSNWNGFAHCGNMINCSKIDCHKELQEKYGDNFYRGTDRPGELPHPGVHKYTHFAEEFIKGLKDL